jgi:hypothetical protein
VPDAYGLSIGWEWMKKEFPKQERCVRSAVICVCDEEMHRLNLVSCLWISLNVSLSQQAEPLLSQKKDTPLPLYSAVRPRNDPHLANHRYEWFEFSPFEVAAHDSGVAIPTWAFGREFDAGVSMNFAPEPSLASVCQSVRVL